MKLPFGLTLNPVMARESRVRMRGWKAPALISLYVAVLGGIAWVILAVAHQAGPMFAPQLGGTIFGILGFTQFILLAFSAPGLTAGAIAGEREKQTLDLLLITRMSPLQVVIGKLGSAVAFTLLLMMASLPVYSLLFLVGGVSLIHLARTVVIYVVTVFLLGSIGLYFSSLFKRTQAAVVASYGLTLGLMLLPFVASLLVFEVFTRPPDAPPGWATILAYMNPVMGLAAGMGGTTASITTIYSRILMTPAARDAIWWKYSLFALAAGSLLIWITARRIRPHREK